MAFAKNLNRTETLMSTAQRLRLEGHQQGLTQGLNQGLSQGRAEALLRLLAQRFGALQPAITRQVMAGSNDELDRWLDRVLAAPTLADVFAG